MYPDLNKNKYIINASSKHKINLDDILKFFNHMENQFKHIAPKLINPNPITFYDLQQTIDNPYVLNPFDQYVYISGFKFNKWYLL